MKNTLTNSKTAGMIGLLLVLPGAWLLTLLVLHIEPPLGFLEPYLVAPPGQPGVTGSLVALTLILVLPAIALAFNIQSVRQNRISGSELSAQGFNLTVIVLAALVILTLVGGFIVDQYPCWIGVPNCD